MIKLNIENMLKPDAALVAAVTNVNERELKLSALFERGGKQKDVIADLSDQLNDLVAACEWVSAKTPEDAKQAKRQCANLTEKLEEERELLNAIDTAIRNSRQDIALAKHRVEILTNAIIKEAAVKVEPEARKNLIQAMKDFFACQLAKDGIRSVSTAQHELENLSQDHELVRGVEKRVNSIYQSLRESVAA